MRRIQLAMAVVALLPASQAFAQSNPFRPPTGGGGLSQAQIQEMVNKAMQRQRAGGGALPGDQGDSGLSGQMRSGPNVNGIPSQRGGRPMANVAGDGRGPAGGGGSSAPDAVADVLSDGGSFVGCVSSTPVFKDKVGRRVYFTTKELRESNAARRYAHCG